LSVAQVEQRRAARTTHGATSPPRIAAKARAHRRRFLRRAGLRATDLDPVTNELLTHWARGVAQLDLREAGGVDSGRDYWVAYNGTRRTLEKLEKRLQDVGLGPPAPDPLAVLAALRESA
jgi:hypothetical protein